MLTDLEAVFRSLKSELGLRPVYHQQEGLAVSRAEFEENMDGKLHNRSFLEDIEPLLPAWVSYDVAEAGALVRQRAIAKLPGEPWKGADG